MSLLLEALKKAELAKQAAKEQPPAADAAPPFTRDRLPDISQPMEIRSEDLGIAEPKPKPAPAPVRAEKPVLELALEEPQQPAPPPPPEPARAAPTEARYAPTEETEFPLPAEAAERKQAQQLFEAKEMDVNPRKPFYITVGTLGLFALCTVGYFWYEMQPKNNYKIPPPLPQSATPPVAAAPAAPPVGPGTPAASTVAPPAGAQPAGPEASAAPAQAPAQAGPRPAPAAAALAPTPAPRTAAIAPQGAPAVASAQAPQRRAAPREGDISITPAQVQPDPILEGAFQAYNAGDRAKARDGYQQVLRRNPDNRDALLGLAAVEIQDGRPDAAERHYMRLLELDPRDAHAQAGLIGLRGQVDPQASESRLKSMIAAQPAASFLHFTLGNQYAAQGRWAEAQQAYFQAYTSDPEHPDFACNLAISLDRMHQTKPALEYYRRALALAADRPVSFDKARIGKRVAQLER
ncbi:MAG: tetratricopeptide repeat protein [Proteobacteria bacterium]|nr:tetratricopeptide repeat protein [Pseudomonadota bacterium]